MPAMRRIPKHPSPAIVLGIDVGTHKCGYGVTRDGKLVEDGIIEGGPGDVPDRLVPIAEGLNSILDDPRVGPDPVAVVEQVQYHPKRPGAVVPLAEVRGVVLLTLAQHHLTMIVGIAANTWKAALTGDGNASKLTVRRFIENEFKIDLDDEPFDVSDALGLSLFGWRRYCC